MRGFVMISLILWVGLAASSASAGRIFGDVKVNGKPVPPGIPVVIAVVPPAKAEGAKNAPAPVMVDSTATDKFGSYKLTVKQEGKCILTILMEKQAPTLEVFSYKEATRYDLILEKKDGKLSIKRK
jgi:hypothetical protein